MSLGIGYFAPCSTEAFRERLQTAAIKRAQEEEQFAKRRRPSAADKSRCAARRKLDDLALAKNLGIELEDLK